MNIDTAGHFALGMWAAFLTCCALLPFRTFRERLMPYSPLFILGCGCWALVPDVPQGLLALPLVGRWVPEAWEIKAVFHGPILGNIFFMHAYIDKMLDRTRVHNSFELAGVVSIVFMFSLVVGWWTISRLRRKRARYEYQGERINFD